MSSFTSVPPTFLNQLFISKGLALAGNSLLVYDYLLTLSLEVTYIWAAPWTLVKALFLINRYGNLLGQTILSLAHMGYVSHGSDKVCKAFEIYFACFGVFSGETIRLLVVMRACAISRCERNVAALLKIIYVLFAAGMLVMINRLLDHANPSFVYLSETGVCFLPVLPSLWLIWLVLLFLDGIVFATVCCYLYRLAGDSRHPTPLIHLLARDTLLFYIATLFNVLMCIIAWRSFGQDPRSNTALFISCPYLSVIGQRLVLNLRRFRGQPEPSQWGVMVNREIVVLSDNSYSLSGPRVGHGSSRNNGSEILQLVELSSVHGPGRKYQDPLKQGVQERELEYEEANGMHVSHPATGSEGVEWAKDQSTEDEY